MGKNVYCASNKTLVLMPNILVKSRHGPVCLKFQDRGKRKAERVYWLVSLITMASFLFSEKPWLIR